MNACMLVIGNEVLSGRTPDRNLNHVAPPARGARNRAPGGAGPSRRRGDDRGGGQRDARAVPLRVHYGGIGPTHDDITADSIAKAFGVGISHHPDAVAVLKANYPPEMLNEARLRMARIPDGASLVKKSGQPCAGVPDRERLRVCGSARDHAGDVRGDRPRARGRAARRVGHRIVLPRRGSGGGAPARDPGGMAARRRDWLVSVLRKQRYGTSIVFRSRDPGALDAAATRFRAIVRGLGEEPVEGEIA